MNYKNIAIIGTVSNSFCDAILDYGVNSYNYHKVLFLSSFIAFIEQFCIGILKDFTFTVASLPYIIIHSLFVLLGYIGFIQAIKHLPVALVALIETSTIFVIFLMDSFYGYIVITPYFLCMLFLFITAIILFSYDSFHFGKTSFKNINKIGYLWATATILFYGLAPYPIKAAAATGADEIAVNLGYYILAVPFFYYKSNADKKKTITIPHYKFFALCFLIGTLETGYFVCDTLSFIEGTPTIVQFIEQMRIFLLFLLSILLKTDKFSKTKMTALILAFIAIYGVYTR